MSGDVRSMPQGPCLADPMRRERYMEAMFDAIAPRYDQFTRWFSFGMDRGWKRELLRDLVASASPAARWGLDVACGTGDLAIALADGMPSLQVAGIDLSPAMISHARPHARVAYRMGNALALPVPDGSVDVLTVGYGLRNLPDHRRALVEARRALAPDGVLAVLDFTRPAWAPWRWLLLSYLWCAGMLYGWCWHRHGPLYGYIAGSINRFSTRDALISDLSASGFAPITVRSHLGGGIAVITARRLP